MARLQPRYTPAEKAVLLMCIRPVERWTADERRTWVRTGTGFRHFIAPNITPIEHYRRPGLRSSLIQPAIIALLSQTIPRPSSATNVPLGFRQVGLTRLRAAPGGSRVIQKKLT